MAKGINIFDSAKGKPKPSSSAKDKPTVEVDGIEAQLNELQNLKTQIANLETELDVVTDEIKTIAKEKFVELYLENGRNPNTFLLKDGSGCVMVIPTDKYISIKDEDRANQLIETYGEDIVTIDEKYYFNPEVLERNMKAIEKLIRDAKGISDADKQNLLIREVKYSVTKGTIDELYDYGEDMEAVINDIQPIITLKNCGGKMAEGGTDGEFIANVYDDYDAEAGSNVTSMYSKGGMTQNEKYDLLYNFVDEKMIEGDEQAERIINGELPNGYNDLYDFVDEKMIEGDSQAAKLLNKINKYALGGFFGNSRYNTGRSWHLDHARHNKKESYEKPLNKRSRRFKRK
jgi:hypothetical protein